MPFVEWKNGYSVGIRRFDNDHRHLIGLLNTIYDGFFAGSDEKLLKDVLDKLRDYAARHFAGEERWMKEHCYPGLAGHIREHQEFVARLAEFHLDYARGEKRLFLKTLIFLKHWLADHILVSDAGYGTFAAHLSNPASVNPSITAPGSHSTHLIVTAGHQT